MARNRSKQKFTTDLWQVGIVHQPIGALTSQAALAQANITWLPDPGPFRFIADPFGIRHGDHFTIFVEALDYRIKRGEIHYYQYNEQWNLVGQGTALREPFHLSYPSIIRDSDATYMLPEAHKSGKLTLYRATHFPDKWEPVAILLDQPAIDASIIHYQNRWWMFYALPGPDQAPLRKLYIAYADRLTGPWLPHNGNPVRSALDSARPGGTPFIHNETLYLPTQDNTNGYGHALNLLKIETLTPDNFTATIATHLAPTGIHPEYSAGLHTLSQADDVTLIDVKRYDHSPARRWIDLERRLRRLITFR